MAQPPGGDFDANQDQGAESAQVQAELTRLPVWLVWALFQNFETVMGPIDKSGRPKTQ